MPPQVDMSPILEAIQRRAQGGSPASGGQVVPALSQFTTPAGVTPTGGPNTPLTQPPTALTSPSQPPSRAAGRVVGTGTPVILDEDGKKEAKALVSRLLKVL